MTTAQSLATVAIFALGTFATRAIAFVLFPANRPTPRFVVYLGRVLPFAISAMLIVYCLRHVTLFQAPYGLPELISVAAVVLVYLVGKNSLVAIAGGTVLYMLLVQLVFV